MSPSNLPSTIPATHTIEEIGKMARAISASGLFGIQSPAQAAALMLIAQAEGLHPATAARDYHVIQGRPALKADAMLARFQNSGGRVEWEKYTDTEVIGHFAHQQGGKVKITWTMEQAKSIGLTNKDNWRKYPRAMLRARCISEGIRCVFPAVVTGVYTPEETEDFGKPPATMEIKDPKLFCPECGAQWENGRCAAQCYERGHVDDLT